MEFTRCLGWLRCNPFSSHVLCFLLGLVILYALRPNRASCERHSVCWHVMVVFCIINTMFQFNSQASNYSRGIWVSSRRHGGRRGCLWACVTRTPVACRHGHSSRLHAAAALPRRCHHRSWPSTWCMRSRPSTSSLSSLSHPPPSINNRDLDMMNCHS